MTPNAVAESSAKPTPTSRVRSTAPDASGRRGGAAGAAGAPGTASAASTSSCSSPLLHTTLPPSGVAAPDRSLNRPPASSTIGCSAARSHSETSGSQEASTAPSATSTCDQKSPNARVRQTRRDRSSSPGSRPCSSQPVSEEYDRWASARSATPLTRSGLPVARDAPAQAPVPRAAHQRRPSAGALTTPTSTEPSTRSATSVAQTGTPRTKFLVPSIGSTTHCRGLSPTSPSSSPSTASPGRRPARVRRTCASTAVSASLTGVRSGLAATRRSCARNRARVCASAASASSWASARSSARLTPDPARASRCGRRSRTSC